MRHQRDTKNFSINELFVHKIFISDELASQEVLGTNEVNSSLTD